MLKRSPIKRKGKRMNAWTLFANAYAVICRDDDELIECQCELHCGVKLFRPDLHHTRGKAGKLLFDKRYLIWLTRTCHDRAHLNAKESETWRPRPKGYARV